MDTKKKVGILGGTFNPIHLGHLLLAEAAYDEFKLDRILFIPSNHSYMKPDSEIAKSQLRYEMTRIAISDNPHFDVSDIEIERGGDSYTYQTILELKQSDPFTDYFFIIGADNLFSMDKWVFPEKIFEAVTIIVCIREGYALDKLKVQMDYLKNKYQARIFELPERNIDISSTEIRARVKNGKSIHYMVTKNVQDFISKNQIYQNHE